MQNFGDAVTLILGNLQELAAIRKQEPQEPFSREAMEFLAALSGRIRRDGRAQGMPEAAAFGFWCRMSHLRQMQAEYGFPGETRLGRGVSLHFAPSNMPTLFAFTMAAGLLAGNAVVLRLPGKETAQEELIVSHIRGLLEGESAPFRGRIILCRYPHDQETTDALSSLCDVRVIWGSDESVSQIRRSPLPPRAIDLPFASRGSAALFNARAMNEAADLERIARDFYNDTYLNDQNACSSPRMVYWLGREEEAKGARRRFWDAVLKLLEEKDYQVSPSLAVRKLECALLAAAAFPGTRIHQAPNRLIRVSVPALQGDMWEYTAPGGFFIEGGGETLEGMADILDGRCQTLSAYGVDSRRLAEELGKRRVMGVDRIVPVGHALDFTLTWDGIDLIGAMSRRMMCGNE